MNGDRKERKTFLAILVVAALGIWGYNAYQIYAGTPGESGEALSVAAATDQPSALPPAFAVVEERYRGGFRGPFVPPGYALPQQRTAEPRRPSMQVSYEDPAYTAAAIEPPPVQLHGIIGATAIVQVADHPAVVVTVGESVAEITVKRIGLDQVEVTYQGQVFTLSLSE